MIERRKSIRVECELATSFRDLDSGQPGRIESGVVKNISRGGIRIRVDAFVPLQDRLYLYLRLPSNQTLEIQIKPSWIVELPHLNKYDIGAHFISIRDEEEEVIENFQYQALLEKMPFRNNLLKDLLKDEPQTGADAA